MLTHRLARLLPNGTHSTNPSLERRRNLIVEPIECSVWRCKNAFNPSFTKSRHASRNIPTRVLKGTFMSDRLLAAAAAMTMVLATLSSATAVHAQDEGILRVYMNSARVLKLDRPVSKVIVGNAEVADATVADARTIVLTGRSYGTTNLVLLDADGNAIVDERILVSIDEASTVRVFKSTARTVLSCTPNCEEHAKTGATP